MTKRLARALRAWCARVGQRREAAARRARGTAKMGLLLSLEWRRARVPAPRSVTAQLRTSPHACVQCALGAVRLAFHEAVRTNCKEVAFRTELEGRVLRGVRGRTRRICAEPTSRQFNSPGGDARRQAVWPLLYSPPSTSKRNLASHV